MSTIFLENLAEANRRADALALKLEKSEKARQKAEADARKAKAEAATVEELRKKLHEAESSLSEHISAQSAREEAILKCLASQSRRFASKCPNYFDFLELLLSCFPTNEFLP
jgi:septal ring factor EnvC (AmiA/AmiB activator)